MDCSSGCLNTSRNFSKSFSLMGFTVCPYGQGEGVGVAVVIVVARLARPGPVRSGDPTDSPDAAARQRLAVIGPII